MPVITNVNKQQAPSAIKTPALTLHKAKKDILALAYIASLLNDIVAMVNQLIIMEGIKQIHWVSR